MANRVVDWYRGQNPDDARSDDELTLDLAVKYPDNFQTYPDAMADFDRIRKELLKAQATPVDYVKQAAGNFIRGATEVAAGLPESIAIGGSALSKLSKDTIGIGLGDEENPEDQATFKLGQRIRSLGEKIAPDSNEGLDDSFLASKLPSALGSAAGFMAGGAAGRALKVPELIGIGGLGAVTQASGAWKEAKASGASDDDAYKVFLFNAGVGTSEVLPLSRMLKRLDGISGGAFTKTLLTAGKETFEEAFQEAGQQFAQNYIAKQYYDKDRDLLKDIGENAAAGGVTGALFSILTSAIGAKIGKSKTSTENVDDKGKTPQTITSSNAQAKGAEMPVSPQPASVGGQAASEATSDVDVRQNFVTEDDKAKVAELVKLQAENKTGPQVDALSAEVGKRIDTAPALYYYYGEELKKAKEAKQEKPAVEPKPSEETIVQGLLDDANTVFEQKRKADEEAAAQAQRDAEAQPAVVAPDQATTQPQPTTIEGGESNGSQEKGQGQEVLKAQAEQPLAAATTAANVDLTPAPVVKSPYRSSAIKLAGGKIFEGNSHGQALNEARASGLTENQIEIVDDGFVTHGGRYVSRSDTGFLTAEDVGLVPKWRKLTPDNGIENVLQKVIEQKAAVTAGEGGQGKKAATIFEETDNLDELYKDSKASGANRTQSRKLAVLLSPDQTHVVIGTAYRNASGGKLQDMVTAYDESGSTKSQRLPNLLQAGWRLIGSIKTDEPTKGYVATHSVKEWEQLKTELGNLRQSQASTAETMATQIEQAGYDSREEEKSALAEKLDGLTQAEDTVEGDLVQPEEKKIRGFGPEEGKAIFDALQGKTRDELKNPEVMLDALGGSKRAMHAVGNMLKALFRYGIVSAEDVDGSQVLTFKLIYEATVHSGRNEFAESILHGVSQARVQQAQAKGAGHPNAGTGGESGAGTTGGQGNQAGAAGGGKAEEVAKAAAVTKANPTEAEKKSGEYPKGVVTLDGLDIVIESPQGATRSGKDAGGKPWSVIMPAHYGYVKGTEGKDGDEVDVFIGEHPEAATVWVIDQINPKTKKFDEHKALVGFDSKDHALAAYDASFSDGSGPSRRGAVVQMEKQDFVDWVNEGNTEAALEYGRRTRHAKKSKVDWAALEEEALLQAELNAENGDTMIDGPGWLGRNGEFLDASDDPLSGHLNAAMRWLTKNNPKVAAKLDVEDYNSVYDAMYKLGFVRVAGDASELYVQGSPTAAQLATLKDSAIFHSAYLIQDIGNGRSRTLYAPEMSEERFSSRAAADMRADGIRFAGLLSALASMGVNVKLVTERVNGMVVESGKFTQYADKRGRVFRHITVALADATQPTTGNFKDLLEESLHAVYGNEAPARQAQMERAIAQVGDELLGISGLKLSDAYSPSEAAAALQEERLVAVVGKKLEAEGFTPAESAGFAQAIVRWLKDLYHRVVMAVMEASGLGVSAERAQAYFENRVKAILSGDAQIGVIDFMGGPKLSEMEKAEQSNPIGYAEMIVGNRERNSVAKFRFVDNPREPATPDQNSTELMKPKVAAQNFIQSVMVEAFNVFEAEGLNTAGLTLEDFLRNRYFLELPEKIGAVTHYNDGEIPSDVVAEYNKQLEAIGQPVVNPALKLNDVSETVRKRAVMQAHRVLLTMTAELSERRRVNERDAKAKYDRLQKQNRDLGELMGNYEDLDLVLSICRTRFSELLEGLRKAAVNINSKSYKSGAMEQVIKAIDGKLNREGVTQYEKALDAISRKLDSGEFSDALEAVAALGIDWNTATAADIRAELFASGDARLQPLIKTTPESKAMLAGVIAFSKSDGHVMDLLSLRREKEFEARKAVNEALNVAVSNHSDAIREAKEMVARNRSLATVERDAAGNVVNVQPTRVGKRALRLLNRIEHLKTENRKLMDEIQREGVFNQWHEAARPLLRNRLSELERMLGAQYQDWHFIQGAAYPVPPKEDSKLDEVLASQKQVNLSDISGLKADMMKLRNWLDNVPEDQRGADWADMDDLYRKVCFNDITRNHEPARQNFLMRWLAPMPDRLRFIGTPTTRALASRIYNMQAALRSLGSPIKTHGETWEAAEAALMKATGVTRQDVLRRWIYQPAMGWLEKNMHLLAEQTSAAAAENAAIKGIISHLALDPTTAEALKRPGAQAALEKYLLLTTKNAGWVAANGKQFGNKVLDEAGSYKVYRDVIGLAPFTVLRSFSEAGERIFDVMRSSPWATQKLQRGAAVDAYNTDPEKAAEILKPYVTDVIWSGFVRRWAYRDGRSAFYAPRQADGLHLFAKRDNVIKAYEAAKGDLIKFAETLYALEGGTTDIGEFVGDTLEQWQANYDLIESLYQDQDTSPSSLMPAAGPRRFIADARKSEEVPREFLEYLPYDSFTLGQITKGQVYQANFGRNLSAWASNMATAKQEQEKMAAAYRTLEAYFLDRGLSDKKLKAAMQAEVAGGWKNIPDVALPHKATFDQLELAAQNLHTLTTTDERFKALLTLNRMRPPEFRAWNNLVGSIAGATVSGPATAITDNIATVEQPFRKLGFDWQAVKFVLGTKKTEMAVAANSFLQMWGVTIGNDAAHMQMLNDIGIIDDDATISMKDKAAAYFLEEHNLVNGKVNKAIWKLSSAVRFFMGTGIGRAREGAPAYPTFKPHSPFQWGAQISHMAVTLQLWRTYETLVGAAVRHFEANPADLANPEFRFQRRQLAGLGFKSGWRAWEFLNTRLADYGLGGLEQVARESVGRRAKDAKAALLTKADYQKLAQLAQNEVTLDSGIATRHPFLVTNDKGTLLNPLLGWAVNKSYDFAAGFRNPDGKKTAEGTRTALVATVFAVLPAALAYALMRDLYDEYVMKRKSNTRDLRSITSPQDALLTLMDNVSRVGTLGMAGEKLNQFVNFDSSRPVSIDSRVFMVSTLLNLERSMMALAMQGGAMDWATTYRPLLSALGGSGYLQYADSLNGVFGMDNQEARVTRRTAVNNYLRAAGKELKLDVRKSMGGAQTLPTEQKMYVGQMVVAALANDHVAFNDAFRNAKLAAKSAGSEDPEATIKRSYSAYNPLRTVFQTEPSEVEYRRMLATMTDTGRESVASALRLYAHYGEQIGVKASLGKKPANKPTMLPQLPKVVTLDDLRKQAVSYGQAF